MNVLHKVKSISKRNNLIRSVQQKKRGKNLSWYCCKPKLIYFQTTHQTQKNNSETIFDVIEIAPFRIVFVNVQFENLFGKIFHCSDVFHHKCPITTTENIVSIIYILIHTHHSITKCIAAILIVIVYGKYRSTQWNECGGRVMKNSNSYSEF